jgi:hypothetical protein
MLKQQLRLNFHMGISISDSDKMNFDDYLGAVTLMNDYIERGWVTVGGFR